MSHVDKMREYLALVEVAMGQLVEVDKVIDLEVERSYGRKIKSARTSQERVNLRQHYRMQLGRENIWKQTYMGDRDLYIRLATMYGIAAQVEAQQPVGQIYPRGMYP